MAKLRIAPEEEWNDSPLAITMQVSSAWISVVINELQWLTNHSVWDGDENEKKRASQAIQSIIDALSREDELTGGSSVVEVGTIAMFAVIPNGYLECNGAAISRSTYADLFALVGTTFGAGDGTTTFNLPDLTDRFPLGAGINSVGAAGGEEEHSLTIDEIPQHSHQLSLYNAGGSPTASVLQAVFQGAFNANINTAQSGSGGAHNNMPPYLALKFGIKV